MHNGESELPGIRMLNCAQAGKPIRRNIIRSEKVSESSSSREAGQLLVSFRVLDQPQQLLRSVRHEAQVVGLDHNGKAIPNGMRLVLREDFHRLPSHSRIGARPRQLAHRRNSRIVIHL